MDGDKYFGKSPSHPDPQELLDDSISIKDGRRVGYDSETGEIVQFHRHGDWWERWDDGEAFHQGGHWHGFVVPWDMLADDVQKALIQEGLFGRRGNYLGSK